MIWQEYLNNLDSYSVFEYSKSKSNLKMKGFNFNDLDLVEIGPNMSAYIKDIKIDLERHRELAILELSSFLSEEDSISRLWFEIKAIDLILNDRFTKEVRENSKNKTFFELRPDDYIIHESPRSISTYLRFKNIFKFSDYKQK